MTKTTRVICLFIVLALIFFFVAFIFRVEIISFWKNNIHKENYQIEYANQVKKASEEFNVPEDLIFAIIKTESNFKSDAVSSADAVGLMQLIPETFKWVSSRLGEDVTDDMISNPDVNIRYGTYYLRFLLDRLENDEAVYAAYNAGYSRVKGWLSDTRYSSDGKTLNNIPYNETSNYVKAVAKARAEYKKILTDNNNLSE